MKSSARERALRISLVLVLAAAGLFLYLWPAFRAPVVMWSDSELDMGWARAGVGIVSPLPLPAEGVAPPPHSAKPGYLLFLRVVLSLAPGPVEGRTVVVVQSVLLWISIVATAAFVERRHAGAGVVLLLAVLSLLRLRDTASAVMPEALSAALLLPLVASALFPSTHRALLFFTGVAVALLFWIRPNVGAVALVLAVVGAAISQRVSGAVLVLAGFIVLFLPVWMATKPREPGETLRGTAHAIVFGSADYNWIRGDRNPTEGRSRDQVQRQELDRSLSNWKALLRGGGPDRRRQLVWRALHGLFGTEFYDPRWSRSYATATFCSRMVTPFETVLAIACLIATRVRRAGRWSLLGLLLLVLLGLQDFLLISHPRFVLPFLPALYLIAIMGVMENPAPSLRQWLPVAIIFVALLAFVATHRFILDWEWGRIESAGITIRQRIPIRSFPRKEPATLHVRLAPALVPSAAHFEMRGPNAFLYSSVHDGSREKPVVSVALPASLLEANRRGDIELEISTFGSYGAFQYLLFPVIPRPWGAAASRASRIDLSPTTGIRAGSLDWWAHAGRD